MNIAFLSNSWVNRTLAFQTSYVFGKKIDNIFLSCENHSMEEKFPKNEGLVKIIDDIDFIIENSDILIASKPDFQKYKKTILVKNPWTHERAFNNQVKQSIAEKPTIALLSVGVFTDVYYLEVIVNRILSEKGAKVYQIFSQQTESIFSDLANNNLINEKIIKQSIKDADVCVVTLDCTKYRTDADFICELSNISPGMIFLCMDNTVTNTNLLKTACSLFGNISFSISSPYIPYDAGTGIKYPVYWEYPHVNSDINSFDDKLETEIERRITEKLYYPSCVKFI